MPYSAFHKEQKLYFGETKSISRFQKQKLFKDSTPESKLTLKFQLQL